MDEEWLDTLIRGTFEVSVPTLAVTSEEIGTLIGSGQISWHADSGIRIQAMTNGGDTLIGRFFSESLTPGFLIPRSVFLTFSGRTQSNWELAADPMYRTGHDTHTNLPGVSWDLRTTGITLTRELSPPRVRSLSILMGPLPPQWLRATDTEVRNEVFGRTSSRRDWLTTNCSIGKVSARQRSDDWFEVLVLPPDDEALHDAITVRTAVARAFGFVLGRRCVIRGHEEFNESKRVRRLDSWGLQSTSNNLHQPLGTYLEFVQNVERLLGLAIDFFLTELGDRVVPYLELCWDTADNSYQTRLAMSSICVEGLLRVAAETIGPLQSQVNPADLKAFQDWLKTKPNTLSEQFRNRLGGLVGTFSKLSANEIFRDWIKRGVLGVTNEDSKAWSDTRNPILHGELSAAASTEELQTRVSRHNRIQNVLNKIFLQMMGYSGTYLDYAQPGYSAAEFPVFSKQAEAEAKTASPNLKTENPIQAQSEELQFTTPLVQLQAGDIPTRLEGWTICYSCNDLFLSWYQLVAKALRVQFPGATVIEVVVDGFSASITVNAPEGTPDELVDRVQEIVNLVGDIVAQKVVSAGTPTIRTL